MMQLPPVTAKSPAKLNLFLHVHQQRLDGYHEIKTYFQLVDLYDTLTFTLNDHGTIAVHNPAIAIAPQQDLCYRAAQLLAPYLDRRLGVTIAVDKRIPDGGGLGGGSSNAATVLNTLNTLWDIHLSKQQLLDLALQLGSDVPVFVYGQSTYAEGRGEQFSQHIPNAYTGQAIVIVKPKVHASTAQIFQSPLLQKRPATTAKPSLEVVRFENDFEPVVLNLYPEIAEAYQQLSTLTPAHLTGTGACLYGFIDDKAQFERIQAQLGERYQLFFVRGIADSAGL